MFFENINIDDAFREQLGDYEQNPPSEAWDEIESSLNTGQKSTWKKYLSIAALILLFLAVGSLIIYQNFSFFHKEDISNIIVVNKSLQSSLDQENTGPNNQIATLDKDNSLSLRKEDIADNIVNQEMPEDQSGNIAVSTANIKAENSNPILKKLDPFSTGLKPSKPSVSLIATNTRDQRESTFSESDDWNTFAMQQTKERHLVLAGNISPTISYRKTTGRPTTNLNERSLISYSGGVTLGYKLNERLKLKSGVFYSQMGQTLSDVHITPDSYLTAGDNALIEISGSIGTSEIQMNEVRPVTENVNDPDLPLPPSYAVDIEEQRGIILEESLLQKMEFIKIPFLLEYKFVDKNIGLSMITGLNANMLVGKGIFMQNSVNNKKVGDIHNINRISYSGTVGLGIDYQVNDFMQISMQPLMDYFLNSFNSTSGKTFPYSFGLYTGLSVSF